MAASAKAPSTPNTTLVLEPREAGRQGARAGVPVMASPSPRPKSRAALIHAPSIREAMAWAPLGAPAAWWIKASVPSSPTVHGSVARPSMTARGTTRPALRLQIFSARKPSCASPTSSTSEAKGPAA